MQLALFIIYLLVFIIYLLGGYQMFLNAEEVLRGVKKPGPTMFLASLFWPVIIAFLLGIDFVNWVDEKWNGNIRS